MTPNAGMKMDFDTPINRKGTHSTKWDMMEPVFGVPGEDGLPMWVADMDFRSPDCVQEAVRRVLDHGNYGYYGDDGDYLAAIQWWMAHRHGWTVEPDWIFTTHGLVNGTALCLQAFTQPGDGVVLMTPVYHAFSRVIKAAGRQVVECRLALEEGRYRMDFDAWDAQMTGREKMVILCSPHNPGGRVWSISELRELAEFCRRHDLILVSDEIHHDLVKPGHKHHVMASIEGILDRLVVMTAASKTFNIAGMHIGNVIVPDPGLRARFKQVMLMLGISPNSIGMHMVTAAYSPEGAAWVDRLNLYLDGNRRVFDAGVNAIPGLRSMPLEATYLAWVSFAGTGMTRSEFTDRVEKGALIAANHGNTFGAGGESFLRFNLGAPRQTIQQAVERLARAFGDLQ